jgi:hypothetical protein
VLYVGDTPEGAIAETFGRFDLWDQALIEADPAVATLPGSRFALAVFEAPDNLRLRNLDDMQALLEERLRPSNVVTRDRKITQAWAARIHETGRYAGVAWWSYYEPSWQSIGIWDLADLQVTTIQVLRRDDPDVVAAARTIYRRIA